MPSRKRTRGVLSPEALQEAETTVEPYDFANPNRLPRQILRALTNICEEAARDITRLLSDRDLTAPVVHFQEIRCARAETLAEELPRPTMVVILATAPVEGVGLLQMDLPVAFALLNHLLGGSEMKEAPQRGLSPLEHAALEELVDSILGSIRQAWEPACRLDFTVTQRTDALETLHFGDPKDWLLLMCFHLESPIATGDLRLAVPAAVTDHVSRSESRAAGQSAPPRGTAEQERQLKLLGDVCVEFTARLGPMALSLSALSAIEPEDVLILGPREENPVSLVSGDRYRLRGRLVAQGRRLAVQIAHRPGAKEERG